jgi:hypothetical protein
LGTGCITSQIAYKKSKSNARRKTKKIKIGKSQFQERKEKKALKLTLIKNEI